MANIAIIPARGGSKRIPRKNIKNFLGKPIISYSIETVLDSGLFEQVIVSTDSEEIAEISRKYGAEVPFLRSESNSDDYATTADVLLEVLENLKDEFEYFCCIYPTAPLLQVKTLKEAFQKMVDFNFDTVFPVVPFSYPIWRSIITQQNGRIKMNWPENLNKRSQDLPSAFHDAGQFYWGRTDRFLEQKKLWTDHTGAVILNEMEVQDIDSTSDWVIAELKFKLLANENL
ncbi:pseudaminic acid cytidylyltransferase [Jiulongibacter sp. NS-SX5]|uniref:pseudaminic acid cytidylyltransferase n=1 Tax=Jiulongibacter sp. NS-SX5 TaxID=3463854 RepID=UPI004058A004